MKKTLIIICTVLMILSLASCGGKSAGKDAALSSSKSVETDSGQGKLLSTGYADIMKSGKFLIRYKTSVTDEGKKTDAEITTATEGKNVATILKSKDLSTHTIIKDNVLYLLDDAHKTYSKMNVGQNEQSSKNGSLNDTESLKYTGSGTGTVNGKILPYEEYTADDTTLRFFMDGNKLYAITTKTKSSETEMIVLELTGNIPAGMISVPADYKESTAMAIPGNIDTTADQTDTDDE